jgi:hypothetical protein
MRLRLVAQRTAIWAANWDAANWIQTGRLDEQPAAAQTDQPTPAQLIAREQIRRDGGKLIVENVIKAVEQWQQQTSKPDEPT